ncbi:MAG: hypothetical protein E7391_00235 [Ruminococcaceae bacterium]|nr:hypothetical protein [Oscillospiraceae bacterium]
MKTFQKLSRFPLGAITASGFLKDQMKLGKDGMSGHLHELEPEMIADPYVNKSYVKAWGNAVQNGWGAEISGNYWTGYIQHAFTLKDEAMIKTATNWVNGVLKNQKDDGYLGTYTEPDATIYDDYNAWGTACAMRGLIAFYEATGRDDVLQAVYRCMLWFCDKWGGENKTCYAGQYIIEPMVFTYFYTGDEMLIEFCEDYMDYLCRYDYFGNSYKSMLDNNFQYNSNHTAGLGINLKLPALVYAATGNTDYLKASEHRINQVLEKACHITGSPISVSEYLGPVGCTTETEYCSYAFYNSTYSYMSYITGEAKYGDLMEVMFYNGAQGARKKDEKAIAYLSAPNQTYATVSSSSFGVEADMQVYAPCYPVSCCPVNAVTVVPEFVRGMLLRDNDDNVYVMAYGPCNLRYKDTSLYIKTLYPFRNSVLIEMDCDKKFALNLKIPSWSKGFTLKVNNEKLVKNIDDKGFVTIENSWKKGDIVEIVFEATVEIVKIDDSDLAKNYPLAFKYGALVFSYHIPEKWTAIEGNPMTKLPEGWSWYNVSADYEEPVAKDIYELNGLRRYQFSWNIVLDENISPEDVEIEEVEENGYVWEKPVIKLHTYCYKAPYMSAPYQKKTFEPYGEYHDVTEKLPLVLEPYGCTNLRLTYFSKAKNK